MAVCSQTNEPPRKKRKHKSRILEWAREYKNYVVELDMPSSDSEFDQRWDQQFPHNVTFVNLVGKKSSFKILNTIDDRSDMLAKVRQLGKFNTTKSCDWSRLRQLLEQAKYTRPEKNTAGSPWKCTEEVILDEGDPLELVWDLLANAFMSDFMNGDIKKFLHHICDYIIKILPAPDLLVDEPFPTSITNSVVRTATHTAPWQQQEELGSPHSSELSLPSQKPGIVVPDVVIYHKYEQLFILNVECKRSADNFDLGVVHCMKQMLSQMHGQKFHFGIVLSPIKWHLMVLLKNHDTMDVWQTRESLVTLNQANPDHVFNIGNFIQLLDWMYNIIAFHISD
ncbi:uncharacterized protein LOC106158858 [Lingula anatina]|uniref:Uncharacterized protein LOC106158858 n=1 Tax=Lingula anatina TaxID=7574 RepID=A0A1S3HWK3_LINAN|nr:uncharacterized protein LOC106158858 [Lingula anatina]|eukprot:XP_013390422.1 uncharacterized protein LOC106158858 [Lingula anatina]